MGAEPMGFLHIQGQTSLVNILKKAREGLWSSGKEIEPPSDLISI